MKHLLLILSLITLSGIFGASAMAQVVPDRTETDCAANTRTLYNDLDEGTVVVVAMLAFDCPICNGDAPYVHTFAQQNEGIVRVWAPMFNLVHPGGKLATCDSVTNWRATYGWDNIFLFVNDPITWAYEYGVHYIIVDPRDRSVYWRGNNVQQMQQKAMELAALSDIDDPAADVFAEGISPNPATASATLRYVAGRTGAATVGIYDVLGKLVATQDAAVVAGSNTIRIDLPEYVPTGNYSVVVTEQGGRKWFPLVVQ